MEKFKEFAERHPWAIGGIVFLLGVLLILWWRRGTAQPAAANTGIDAYYAALAAQTQSGNQLAATMNSNQTAVAIAGIEADAQKAGFAASANVANTATAGTVSIAQNSTIDDFLSGATGQALAASHPGEFGIYAARVGAAVRGTTDTNGNAGYPSNWFSGQPGATATPFNIPNYTTVPAESFWHRSQPDRPKAA